MTSATPARGRPRSANRTAAILDATRELIREHGYDGLRMQDVAERARSGLATIYRRWPSKPDLVAVALDDSPGPEHTESGDPLTDLRSLVAWLAVGQRGDYVAGFFAAARDHEVVREAVRKSLIADLRTTVRGYLAELTGLDGESLELVADAIPALIVFRVGLLYEPVDPEKFADEIVKIVALIASAQS